MSTDATEDAGLFGLVHQRLVAARTLLAEMDTSAEVKDVVSRRLDEVERDATHALTIASRRLESMLDALEAGRSPVAYDD